MISPDKLRSEVIDVLTMLSSRELQLEYERNVSAVDVTTELVCIWFDDLYYPDHPVLPTAFTPQELVALLDFHQYYDSQLDHLPEGNGTVQTWLSSNPWQRVMAKARKTLDQLSIHE